MNNHVLVAMDRRNYTTKELENNVGYADNDEGFDSHAQAAFNVALAAYEGSIHFDLWLGLYFAITGENRQDYINAIEGLK